MKTTTIGFILVLFGFLLMTGLVIPFTIESEAKIDLGSKISFWFMGFVGLILFFKGLNLLAPRNKTEDIIQSTRSTSKKMTKIGVLNVCAMIAGIIGAIITLFMWLDLKFF
jgi:hypothetical protein